MNCHPIWTINKVKNTNTFAISIYAIESFLQINDVKYQLLHTEESTSLEPNTWQTVTLCMENTPGKTLSMVLNTIQSSETEFKLGGTIECQSPYGWILIPIDLMTGAL